MVYKLYFGIDNGVSGSLGVLGFVNGEKRMEDFTSLPIFSDLSYTKKRRNITRIHVPVLRRYFKTKVQYLLLPESPKTTKCDIVALIERPMVNPGRFMATLSAIRALEAVLISLPKDTTIKYCDSKEWQKKLLPEGSSGPQLKHDSLSVGCRLFPVFKDKIVKHKDADGMLIAEYLRREQRG